MTPTLTIPARKRPTPVRPLRLGLFGGPLDTGNNGVTALGLATLRGLARCGGPLDVTIFDSSPGERRTCVPVDGGSLEVRLVGCYHSRRYYRRDNLEQILLAARVGLKRHPLLERLDGLDAVLDISGGDSFGDLYGMREFRGQCLPKQVVLAMNKPLVLLPQSYGPFGRARARTAARSIMCRAVQVWARESRSEALVRSMLEGTPAQQRVRLGVDVAFGLPACRPPQEQAHQVLSVRYEADLLVGINVSGLLYNRPGEERRRFGYRASYRDLLRGLLSALGRRRGLRILLVPHVCPQENLGESDAAACAAMIASAPRHLRGRLDMLPAGLGPCEAKWAIGQCDFFCGTRLHACIAALSQGVPVAAVAYSEKAAGVCEDLGVPEAVVDPRCLATRQALRAILELLDTRALLARRLNEGRATLDERLESQFKTILSEI